MKASSQNVVNHNDPLGLHMLLRGEMTVSFIFKIFQRAQIPDGIPVPYIIL